MKTTDTPPKKLEQRNSQLITEYNECCDVRDSWCEEYTKTRDQLIAAEESEAVWKTVADKADQRRLEAEAEVARLRELLNRAIEIADEFWKNQKQAVTVWHGELADELEEIKAKARLAPAPEETQDGATMDEWYYGFSKIENTEPTPKWRELGPDELIQEGD